MPVMLLMESVAARGNGTQWWRLPLLYTVVEVTLLYTVVEVTLSMKEDQVKRGERNVCGVCRETRRETVLSITCYKLLYFSHRTR